MALAMHSNAPHDVMNALEIFDRIAGGSGAISGAALDDFMCGRHDEEGRRCNLYMIFLKNDRLQYTSE